MAEAGREAEARRRADDETMHEVGSAVTRLIQEMTRIKLARVDPEAARDYLR